MKTHTNKAMLIIYEKLAKECVGVCTSYSLIFGSKVYLIPNKNNLLGNKKMILVHQRESIFDFLVSNPVYALHS